MLKSFPKYKSIVYKEAITRKKIYEESQPPLPFFLYSFEPYTKEYKKNESLKNTRRLFSCVVL